MSEILRINDLGTQGLNSDLPPCELPPGFINSGMNFDNLDAAITNYGGDQKILTLPFSSKFIYPVDADLDYLVFITPDSVYFYDGTAFTDITGPVISDGGYNWTGTNIGRIPVFANEDNFPFAWQTDVPSSPVVDLVYDALAGSTWRSVNMRAKSIRSAGAFLIAMNINDSGVHYPDVVQWSHPADVGSVPDSWDYFRDDRLANRVNLGGNGGDIVDGMALRDSFVIYRANGITMMNSTQDEYVFGIRHLSEIATAANVRSIVEVKGAHFILTYDDILLNDGNSINSILHQKIRKDFVNLFNLAKANAAFVIKNDLAKEILFCIPTDDSGCKIAFIYNWRNDAWSLRELPSLSHATFASISSDVRLWDEWKRPDGSSISWDQSIGNWNINLTNAYSKTIIGIGETDNSLLNLFLAEPDNSFRSFIQRTDIPLGGHDTVTAIQRIYPHIKGSGTVKIWAGSQQYANGPVTWKGPFNFNVGVDRKLDVRTSGEIHAYRIESEGTTPWSLSGIDIEYVIAGKR